MRKINYQDVLLNVCAVLFTIVYPALAFGGQVDGNRAPLANLFFTWGPIIVIAIIWIYFMRKMRFGKQGDYIKRANDHMDKVEALLERIAVSVEKNNKP
ncbi:MAG: hypothetical protein EPN25_11810 [Nitrospirae bacterium]|nr:MAG: hypothetical protein EPN25_11810 [Nitrospirota bacterium]